MLDEQRPKYEQRVRTLAGSGHRGSTTRQERAAADYLCEELRSIGLEPHQETFNGSSSLGGRILIHVLVAALAAAFFWRLPAISIALGSVVILSLWREHSTRGAWLSWPLVQSPSANIAARFPTKSPRLRVIVSGHYDTQRTGFIWWLFKYIGPLYWWVPTVLKPPLLVLALLVLGQMAISGVVMGGGERPLLSIANGLLLGIYAGYALFLGDWARGAFVPGAADNATGAAAVLALGEAWRDRPVAGVELVLLLPGCEEAGLLGSAAWADRHRQELRQTPTLFLNLDNLGVGPPRFLGSEVPLFGWPVAYPRAIVEAARETARQLELRDAGPHTMPGPTDGLSFLNRGLPGMTIVSFRRWGYMPWYHQPGDTSAHLDFDAAWQAVQFGWSLLDRLTNRPETPPEGRLTQPVL